MEHPWMAHLDDRVMKLKRTTSCLNKIYADPKLDCQLPRKGSVSGSVLKHAICSLERALATQGPLVFKIGYTHCPNFRVHNPVFGYACDPYQKWETMVAVFVSSEPTGPSFLEAALIQQYKGHLHFDIVLYLFFFWLGTETPLYMCMATSRNPSLYMICCGRCTCISRPFHVHLVPRKARLPQRARWR